MSGMACAAIGWISEIAEASLGDQWRAADETEVQQSVLDEHPNLEEEHLITLSDVDLFSKLVQTAQQRTRVKPPAEDVPKAGDTILVFQEKWLRLILSGEKTMEVRSSPLKPKRYWFGCKSMIYGVGETGVPIKIESKDQWASLRPRHQVPDEASTYDMKSEGPWTRTFGLPLSSVRAVKQVAYRHPVGAIGTVIFRPLGVEAARPVHDRPAGKTRPTKRTTTQAAMASHDSINRLCVPFAGI